MKIIIFSSFYGSGYGLGYSAQKEAEELSKIKDNDVSVVYIEKENNIFLNERITYYKVEKSNLPLFDIVDFYFKLNRELKAIDINSFDLIYIQSLEFGLLRFSKIKKPIFYFSRSTIQGIVHCFDKNNIRIRFLKRIINKILIRLEKRIFLYSKKIFVKSELMKNEVHSLYNVDYNKIILITGGIDRHDFNNIVSENEIDVIRKKYNIPLQKNLILYAGRIIPQKGLIYIIKCLPRLILENIDFRLIIIGAVNDKKYFRQIESIIIKNQLEKFIILVGHVDQGDVYKFMNLADILVSPSLYEPFGMVNLQAAILGKKILISRYVGSLSILNLYNKIKIVENFSTDEITNKLKELIKLETNNLSFDFSFYSWKRVANSLSDIFNN